jgi:hypothetical protein
LDLPEFMRQTSFQTLHDTKCTWQQSVTTDMDFFPFYYRAALLPPEVNECVPGRRLVGGCLVR